MNIGSFLLQRLFYFRGLFGLHFPKQVGSKDEIVQPFVCGTEYLVFVAFPFLVPLVNVKDAIADT